MQQMQITTDGITLFEFNRSAGAYWVKSNVEETMELKALYRFVGWLVGQCITNRCSLGVKFAALLFQRLLDAEEFKVQCLPYSTTIVYQRVLLKTLDKKLLNMNSQIANEPLLLPATNLSSNLFN